MTEKELKFLCKWLVDNSNRPLSKEEKEIIKQAIDKSNSIEDLILIAITSSNIIKRR